MTGRAHLRRRLGAAALFGLTAALVIPALAAAHPLGNFTINHYAGIRVEPDRVLLDVVIDEAEIPAFQARLDFDTDGDGEVSDAETDAGRGPACDKLAPSLALSVNGTAQALTVVEAGLTFPPGVGGLSTMRMVCEYATSLAAPVSATTAIDYKDGSFPDRLGWREIVVSGSGVTLTAAKGAELRTATTSARLTAYPTTLLTQALADASVALTASPGGPTLPPLAVPDASSAAGRRWRGHRHRCAAARRHHRQRARRDDRRTGSPRGGGRDRAGRSEQRGPAVDLPIGRPVALGAAGLDPDRGRARCRACPDAGARQDADGRLSRRHEGDPPARRRARPVGDAVAYDRDPGPGRPGRRRPGVPAA